MLWDLVSSVVASPRKQRVLRVLNACALDKRSIGRLTRLERANVHKALKALVAAHLVRCLTPERPRAKLYTITPLGKKVLKRTWSEEHPAQQT